MNNFGEKNRTFKQSMFRHGISVMALILFALLALGSGSQQPAVEKETQQEINARLAREEAAAAAGRKQQEEAAAAREVDRARGYIVIVSDVTGTVLLNREDTTRMVSSGNSIIITIENANGEYEVAVRDNNGKVYSARKTVSLTGGLREITVVEDPNYVTSPNDLTYVQNTSGGLTITGYRGNSPRVVIPETISGVKVTEIGKNTFEKKYLFSLVIPNTVTSIGDAAFAGNNNLSSLVIPNSVTSIGDMAFDDCGLSSLTLGNRVAKIGRSAFGHNALTTLTIPNSVTAIDDGAFMYNELTSINIPNGVTSIGYLAFAANELTTITIPNSVTSIDEAAFAENKLTTINIPNSVTFIGRLAFNYNPVTTIIIPLSLAKSGQNTGFRQAFFNTPWNDNTKNWDFAKGSISNATSITLPANVDNENLTTNFDQNLVNFYISQNKRAGTYTQENGIWKLTTPR